MIQYLIILKIKLMETKEIILESGKIYSAEDLGKCECKFLKQTNVLIFCKKCDVLYVFDLKFYKEKNKYKLLSIIEEN